MTRMIEGAVIGLGVGQAHARALADGPRSRLRWVYDLDAARMRSTVDELGQGAPAADFEAILSDPAIDLISIATYDDQHAQQVISAIDAGKHVFCEKPLANSTAELAQIRAALERSRKSYLACNLILRAAPLYRWLKREIADGTFGEIYAIDGDYLYGRAHKITDGWRKDVLEYSVMRSGGVHLVDLMLWLTGQRPQAVSAVGNQIATRGTDFKYQDFVAATFQFSSGMVGRITANFGGVHHHQHVLRVFGTKATFLYDDRGARLFESRDPAIPSKNIDHAPKPAQKGALIPSFIDDILGGADREQYFQHELSLMSVCVASDRALATGATVTIDYSARAQ